MKSIFLLSLFLITMVKLLGQSPIISYQEVNSNDNEIAAVDLIVNYFPNQLLNMQTSNLDEYSLINYPKEYQSTKKNPDTKSVKLSQNGNSKYLMRSTLGINGLSKTITTNKGTYLFRQSIGQVSVIGTYTKNNYTIRQGFQQPLYSVKKVQPILENTLNANLYPNPFQQSLNISFGEKITNNLFVVIYNLSGKIIFSNKYPASQQINLLLDDIPNGNYILKINTENKQLVAKILKQ